MKPSKRPIIVIIFLFFLTIQTSAQHKNKNTPAIRISSPPRIDGILDDVIWQRLPALNDFIQYIPYNGQSASLPSEVKIAYDNNALYLGAILYDPEPDSIARSLGKRDDSFKINADMFAVHISPYNDGLRSCIFLVTASDIQSDLLLSPNSDIQLDLLLSPIGENDNWNAVWESNVAINEDGWSVEMKIPLSAIRFPEKNIQDWGFNTFRYINRYNEFSSWSFIRREINQWWTQMGEWRGLANIQPPLRLSFVPYASSYIEHNTKQKFGYSYHGGLDLKYGINESFTLDMTLIPDFGHVQSDDHVLNLSPYEIRYDEKRQFFNEGTDLFNKGGIFYSRRVGAQPVFYNVVENHLQENEIIINSPIETQLINTSKISGRNRRGLGIGVFNAMTAKSVATIRDTLSGAKRTLITQPITNYNLIVLDQTLHKKSFVSLINSNVRRSAYTANVTAAEFRLTDKRKIYRISGNGAYSQKFDTDTTFDSGFKYSMSIGKETGSFQYSYLLSAVSDRYDPNDLGYLRQNNEFEHYAELGYNIFKPFGIFLNMSTELSVSHTSLYYPRKFHKYHIDYSIYANFKNHWFAGMHAAWTPIEVHDYFEPRVENRVFILPPSYHNCGRIATDRRKPFSVGLAGGFDKHYNDPFDRFQYWINFEHQLRLNTNFEMNYDLFFQSKRNEIGYVNHKDDENTIYFGRRAVQTIRNTLDAEYIFNKEIALSFRLRHYWSQADYKRYYLLSIDGRLSESDDYSENHDINYNAFNIDMTFTWNFAPGSELLLVWKNAIYTDNKNVNFGLYRNFADTIESPQINSVSIKVLYYLDYPKLKKR